MVTEVMVKETLSAEMISAGRELIEHLDRAGFPVSAALWFYFDDTNSWRLIIGTPGITDNGPQKAYEEIYSILHNIQGDTPKVSFRDITVVDTKSDRLLSVLRLMMKLPGPAIHSVRFAGNVVNGVLINDVYIYRLG